MYGNADWAILEKKLTSLPVTNANARKLTRFVLAGATVCEVDKQVRILIPAVLREFAGLEKDVVLAGAGNRIEVWSSEKWAAANDDENIEEIDVYKRQLEVTNNLWMCNEHLLIMA